jgi:hypothetical protein
MPMAARTLSSSSLSPAVSRAPSIREAVDLDGGADLAGYVVEGRLLPDRRSTDRRGSPIRCLAGRLSALLPAKPKVAD